MTQKETGGPAYPVFPDTSGGHASAFRGMTLRDHFAGLAMQSIVADPEMFATISIERIAETAYRMADAMLQERVK